MTSSSSSLGPSPTSAGATGGGGHSRDDNDDGAGNRNGNGTNDVATGETDTTNIPIFSLTQLLSKLEEGCGTNCGEEDENLDDMDDGLDCDNAIPSPPPLTCVPIRQKQHPQPNQHPNKITMEQSSIGQKTILLLVLDGTWKHAREMHIANIQHHQYPSHMWQLVLEPDDLQLATTMVSTQRKTNNRRQPPVTKESISSTPNKSATTATIDVVSEQYPQPPHDHDLETKLAVLPTFRPRRFEIRTTPTTTLANTKQMSQSSSSTSANNEDGSNIGMASDITEAWMSTAECIAWIVSLVEGITGNVYGAADMDDGRVDTIATKTTTTTTTTTTTAIATTATKNDKFGHKDDDNVQGIHPPNDMLRLYDILMKPLDAMVEKYKLFVTTPKVRRRRGPDTQQHNRSK